MNHPTGILLTDSVSSVAVVELAARQCNNENNLPIAANR
jgi:hypothetical protein